MKAILCFLFATCIIRSTSTKQAGGGLLLDKSIDNLQQSSQQMKNELNSTVGELIDLKQNVSQKMRSLKNLMMKEYQELTQVKSSVNYLLKKFHNVHCAPCKPIIGNQFCDCTDVQPKQDCLQFLKAGFKKSGLYKIQFFRASRFGEINVFCDQTSQGGGWTTILRRQDGTVNFQRSWKEYKAGFGKLLTEFWFGNEIMHDLTKPSFAPNNSELLINMKMKGQSTQVYAKYQTFEIGDEASKYVLKISGPSGTAPGLTESKSFSSYHNNMKFSTYDSDNDAASSHCSQKYGRVGWWFKGCYSTLLTGNYKFTKGIDNGEISWYNPGEVEPEYVEMKIRRKV